MSREQSKTDEKQKYVVRDEEGQVVEVQEFKYWALRPENREMWKRRMRGHPPPSLPFHCPKCGKVITEDSIWVQRDEHVVSGYVAIVERCGHELDGGKCGFKFFERVVPKPKPSDSVQAA